jgi:hypothetical protein
MGLRWECAAIEKKYRDGRRFGRWMALAILLMTLASVGASQWGYYRTRKTQSETWLEIEDTQKKVDEVVKMNQETRVLCQSMRVVLLRPCVQGGTLMPGESCAAQATLSSR